MDLIHDFIEPPTPFPYRYRKCMFCKKSNIFKAAYKCKDCRKVCHRNCYKAFLEMKLKHEKELELMKSTIEIISNNETVKKTTDQCDIESNITNHGLTNELPSTTSLKCTDIKSNINDHRSIVLNELSSTTSLNVNILNGRRIVDIGHIFNEIQNIRHSGGLGCSFSDMIFKREEINGYFSIFYFHCKICGIEKQISSENTKNIECIPINKAIVNSTVAIGIGHAQLSELSTCIDIPSMSSNTYQSLLSPVGEVVHDLAKDEIKEVEGILPVGEVVHDLAKDKIKELVEGILSEIIAPKSVHEIEENKGDELQNSEKQQHKSFLQTYQDPSTSLAVNILQDVQQIESNSVAVGEENFTLEENKDISAVNEDTKHEIGLDVQQIESNEVALGEENSALEENKDISAVNEDIKHETVIDIDTNELENVLDERSQKKSFWRWLIPFWGRNQVKTKSNSIKSNEYLMLNF
ncbi:uncharacterized protein LOC126549304 isoform X2 [Aphis gossypii]|uniref:uncharacterized protein LOC126549304 isoform X2 n=1 Tax=Aphis gossypii TaxID=80765 RepID=UPI0021594CD7|nr:uncharacterized protein LOC126549304 isoform X2 [Aphis gossypii]XP_050054008.1 uncharacterized protein LOC126549304 isoform X3 [Aphis gossypii]XP_050054010.1 uncharacterized protein LOC126549304 isoform X2 [Aphis gossypii]